MLGPLPLDDVRRGREETVTHNEIGRWLVELEGARRVIRVRVAGEERWAAIEDAGRLRDALGCSLPVGVPRPSSSRCPTRSATSWPGTPAPTGRSPAAPWRSWWGSARRWPPTPCAGWSPPAGWSRASCCPTENGGGPHGLDYCDAEVLRTLRRRSLAALRAEVEPVPAVELARFLPAWQGVGGGLRGREGLVRAVEQLAGAVVPASALETLRAARRASSTTPPRCSTS